VPLGAVLVAAATDVWRYKIYNVVSLPLLATGLIYHGMVGGAAALGVSLLGALFGFGVLLFLYLLGGMGAGDVKLLAAVGAWLGLPHVVVVFLASSLAAGLYALVLIVVYRTAGDTWGNLKIVWFRLRVLGRRLAEEDRIEAGIFRADRRGRLIPFGAMIALGLIATLVWSAMRLGE
jgi:prepilin peptidase CpaA